MNKSHVLTARTRTLLNLLALAVPVIFAGCSGTSALIPSFASPTPPPIPTDIPVAFPTPTITPATGGTPEPDSSLDADLTPIPDLPRLSRLTGAGCCVQPFWSPDGELVLFIDQPQPTAPTGIYGVGLEGGEPALIREQIGLPSDDGRYHAFVDEEGETVVQALDGGDQWVIPNGGRRVFFSPDSTRVAWAVIDQTGAFDRRDAVISVSDIDGTNVAEVITVVGGGIAGWLDEDHLLLTGRERRGTQDVALFSLSVVDGERVNLMLNQRIRSVQVAPGGEWIVYTITLHPDSIEEDGLWVINADGSERYKLDVIVSAQWRDSSHLLVIPFEPGAPSHRLWQFEAQTGEVAPLTDPASLTFKVQGGDWQVSPTGDHVVFVSAADSSLWLITLPPLD